MSVAKGYGRTAATETQQFALGAFLKALMFCVRDVILPLAKLAGTGLWDFFAIYRKRASILMP